MQKLELSLDNENTNSSQVSYLKHLAVYYTKPVSCGNLMQRNHNVLNTINYLNKTCFRHFYTPVPRCLGSNFVVNKPTNGITLLSKILKFLLSYTSVKIFIWIIFSIKLTSLLPWHFMKGDNYRFLCINFICTNICGSDAYSADLQVLFVAWWSMVPATIQ